MKVYMAVYDNGMEYEDFTTWNSDKVYEKKERCIEEVLSKGYTLSDQVDLYTKKGEWIYYERAIIKMFDLVK